MFQFRILRYVPNVIRGEYVNVGIFIQEISTSNAAARTLEDAREFARVRKFHPDADEGLLRNLARELKSQFNGPTLGPRLETIDEDMSNAFQFGPITATIADNMEDELDRLYGEYVSAPRRVSPRIVEHTRDWMREKASEAFRVHKVLGKMSQLVPVESFTQVGDPFRLDFGYQAGTKGFVHVVEISEDVRQAKVLAFTAGRIHSQDSGAKITAIVDSSSSGNAANREFVSKLFEAQGIETVSITAIDEFARQLSRKLA